MSMYCCDGVHLVLTWCLLLGRGTHADAFAPDAPLAPEATEDPKDLAPAPVLVVFTVVVVELAAAFAVLAAAFAPVSMTVVVAVVAVAVVVVNLASVGGGARARAGLPDAFGAENPIGLLLFGPGARLFAAAARAFFAASSVLIQGGGTSAAFAVAGDAEADAAACAGTTLVDALG